jgi:predicted nucleotide-binding protein
VQDLSERDVRKKIAEPFNDGVSFWIGDEFFEGYSVEDVAVFKTERKFSDLLYEIRNKYDLNATPEDIWTYIMEGKIGDNVSNIFVKSRPKEEHEVRTIKELSKNVFIVHGRDHEPMKELKTMLSEFGLNPIILHEQPSGSRTIVEKLEKYSDVGYAFVVLTPDDVGAIRSKFIERRPELFVKRPLKSMFDLKPRARQNVVLEFGYFMGLLGRDRVCCLYKGDVELPSDMHGIVYVPFKDSVKEACDMIIKELKAAGYEIKN